jgi:hypothetical protein
MLCRHGIQQEERTTQEQTDDNGTYTSYRQDE